MRGADVFPSKYLKTQDLQGRRARVLMASVQMEDVGGENKPVLYFHGKERGLVLNVTKWNAIAELYGDESNGWEGKPIVLAPGKTTYQGKRVDCIDVWPAESNPTQAPLDRPAAPPPAAPVGEGVARNFGAELNDEIPFEMSWK